MKQLWVFILVLMLVSCEHYNIKKKSSDAFLNEELKTFHWDEVDEYPTFALCDKYASKQGKKFCFERELTSRIFTFLKNKNVVAATDVNDTIQLSFQISEKGKISILDFEVDSTTIKEIPNIKSLIYNSLDTLPEIFPAIKRGQQVKTKFDLPLVIIMN